MRKIGTIVAIAALAAVAFSPSPSLAFGLRIGPFYFGIPYFGHRHRHHSAPALRDEASLKTVRARPNGGRSAQGQTPQGLMSPLLYPVLALPAVYDEIFSPPSSSPWPFSYDAILQTAFAKTAPMMRQMRPDVRSPTASLPSPSAFALKSGRPAIRCSRCKSSAARWALPRTIWPKPARATFRKTRPRACS